MTCGSGQRNTENYSKYQSEVDFVYFEGVFIKRGEKRQAHYAVYYYVLLVKLVFRLNLVPA